MKISELIKLLNKTKRKFGDIPVSVDELTVNSEADEFAAIHDIDYAGVYMIRPEDGGRSKKQFVLLANGDSSLFGQKDLLTNSKVD